ncbi:MAG: hypothetical protein IKR68_07775 [Lachnospiraceae bacterium]|nr:hypothetical protein [Lachnospiraceae bacterium]
MENKDRFENALEGKSVAPLSIDNKWHRLFKQAEKTDEICDLEEQLNALLKEQGRINSEQGKMRALKSKLMDEIVELMEHDDKQSKKKKEENSRIIDEINQKQDEYEERMFDLPREINIVNKKLMLLTMEQCYQVIYQNTEDIKVISDWINNVRVELKKNIVKKQEMEIRNVEIYSYMHDIFGPEVVELFDIKYDIEGKKQEILERQRARKEQAALKERQAATGGES